MAGLLLFGWVLVACSNAVPTSIAATQRPTQLTPAPPLATETIRPSETPSPSLSPTVTSTGEVTLAAVGDLMLGRSVGEQILEKGPEVVFGGVQAALAAADLRVGNLECALTDTGAPEPGKTFTLKAPAEAAAALQAGGFDLVSLANNHALDYGLEGLQEAQKLLGGQGIAAIGAGKDYGAAHAPVILERNGLRLAFLGYVNVPEERDGFDPRAWTATTDHFGVAWANSQEMAVDIRKARTEADVVIVLLHSGFEIGEYMSTLSGDQREAAHAAIDAGAAVVIGSHPHQLEAIELYHGGLIAYSLGNFVFDDYRGIANASIILQVRLDRNGFQGYTYVPVLIDNGLPHVIPNEQVSAIGTLVAPMPTVEK